MKITIVSNSDLVGGAARAAFRLAAALRASGADARMHVASKSSDLPWVYGLGNTRGALVAAARAYVGNRITALQRSADVGLRSANVLSSSIVGAINDEPGVINLHWVGGEMMSIEDIGRLRGPVVWTLHDMWAFCGAEHYAPDSADARWRSGYSAGNRPPHLRGADIDRWTWDRKTKAWCHPVHIVCPSEWLANCARESKLMANWPITVIPNPIDLTVFRPWPKKVARELLGLPVDTPLIGFGALAGTVDLRKGWDLLKIALGGVADARTGASAVVFGQSRPREEPALPVPVHWIGRLNDDITLALLYSALDVLAVPSRQDNLPQSATEAQCCGCPVVAFDVGGISDAVEHRITGYLANTFDCEELAQGIVQYLLDEGAQRAASGAAMRRSAELWDSQVIAQRYLTLMNGLG